MPALLRLLNRRLARACLLCGTQPGAPVVCTECGADFLSPARPRCACCAARLPEPAPACGRCLREAPHFDATFTLADYAPPMDGVIVALKFGHRLELAAALGALLAQWARAALDLDDALIAPVPLAFERQAERGFNQALEIARVAARDLGLPLATGALTRVKHAPPQEALGLAERRRNVRGAFAASDAVAGRRVIVVDDVMTSGATLDEIARVLKAAGAARVTNLVVARTP
ncbi:MAG TPA: ComF family protein [Burkholderiaceae bacterium]|jgi:ComF family protein|nr:ComF family protein [Burkholderiaceae bacterium]